MRSFWDGEKWEMEGKTLKGGEKVRGSEEASTLLLSIIQINNYPSTIPKHLDRGLQLLLNFSFFFFFCKKEILIIFTSNFFNNKVG